MRRKVCGLKWGFSTASTWRSPALRGFIAQRPVDRRVCAQHGRDVMGWKSPVGVPTWIHDEDMITTSRRQGQGREELSGGSRSANVRGDEQKLHRRPGLRASWHLMAKPIGCGGQGKCSACARKHRVLTWGDLSGVAMQSRTVNPERAQLEHQGPGAAASCQPQASEQAANGEAA